MEFILTFPDSCYNEDRKCYDRFFSAMQLELNRMANSHNKYQSGLPMDLVVKNLDEIKSAAMRVAMYNSDWANVELVSILDDSHKDYNTGNTENLLDAINMLRIEWAFPKHPTAHFRAQSSKESPGMEVLP